MLLTGLGPTVEGLNQSQVKGPSLFSVADPTELTRHRHRSSEQPILTARYAVSDSLSLEGLTWTETGEDSFMILTEQSTSVF